MATNRYVLHFKGALPLPDADIELIREKTNLLDTSRNTLLVEVPEANTLDELVSQLPDWTVTKEKKYAIPSTRQTVLKPPKP